MRAWLTAKQAGILFGVTAIIRGPYKHEETAAAVRMELELRHPDREWNLWVVKKPTANCQVFLVGSNKNSGCRDTR
jgi:hypothetical protein